MTIDEANAVSIVLKHLVAATYDEEPWPEPVREAANLLAAAARRALADIEMTLKLPEMREKIMQDILEMKNREAL